MQLSCVSSKHSQNRFRYFNFIFICRKCFLITNIFYFCFHKTVQTVQYEIIFLEFNCSLMIMKSFCLIHLCDSPLSWHETKAQCRFTNVLSLVPIPKSSGSFFNAGSFAECSKLSNDVLSIEFHEYSWDSSSLLSRLYPCNYLVWQFLR